ncbi:entericidin B membrane lipoprotein [Klebsiella pneumoniae]|uniref:Entericidin B membrane lipoprotein n=1 Tax=Klebsiella pneumoniae TaxID=573 RepID=A0A2X3EUC9_KLEPN|nr:entericidin B membrane lipoprotein [Klebsiella pneumoniae]
MLIGHENKTDTKDDIMVKKTIAAFFTVLVLSSALTACNTTRGVGEDISDGGKRNLWRGNQSSAINAVNGTV